MYTYFLASVEKSVDVGNPPLLYQTQQQKITFHGLSGHDILLIIMFCPRPSQIDVFVSPYNEKRNVDLVMHMLMSIHCYVAL